MNEATKLSLTQRYLLTYIKFRTNNNRQFYAQNKAISEVIGCTESSTKVIINKLIREGYITKNTDNKGRRVLSLSGKEFMPLDGVNMGNIGKNMLKQDVADQERWANYYQQENKNLTAKLKEVESNLVQAYEQIRSLEAIITEQNEVINRYSSSETVSQKPVTSSVAEENRGQAEEMITSLMTKFNLKG